MAQIEQYRLDHPAVGQAGHGNRVEGDPPSARRAGVRELRPGAELVRVAEGEILDVAVDLRRGSPTFGRWEAVRLSGENKRMLWIPVGFAHGFSVLSEKAHVLYKTTDFYAPEHERTLAWNDSDLKIDWGLKEKPIVSEKDQRGTALRNAETFD